jgi:DNA-directed RNA polymerase subunit RPC12/RpoP
MSERQRRLLTGNCPECSARLEVFFTREADGQLLTIAGRHKPPGAGSCGGSVKVIALWPAEIIERHCEKGHETRVVVQEGWMPGETLDPATCTTPGCSGRVLMKADVACTTIRGAFVCSRCGAPNGSRARSGAPLELIVCKACQEAQTVAPATFTIAVVGAGQFRMRCESEGCWFTWETEVAVARCPKCGSHAERRRHRRNCPPPRLPGV